MQETKSSIDTIHSELDIYGIILQSNFFLPNFLILSKPNEYFGEIMR